MAFNIIWSDFAEGQLDAIFEYYSENAGLNVAKRILQKIIAEPDKIITHPEISQKGRIFS
jgi:toxin ParE1/3/4